MKNQEKNELEREQEADYSVLGETEHEEISIEEFKEKTEAFAHYRYFNGERITNSMSAKPQVKKKAMELLKKKQLEKVRMRSGYTSYRNDSQVGNFICEFKGDYFGNVKTELRFSKTEITESACNCSRCYYYGYRNNYKSSTDCEYLAASVQLLGEYLEKNRVGDATNYEGQILLQMFENRRKNEVDAKALQQEKLKLVPKLIKKDGDLSLTFKVGAQKKYVIRNLFDFHRKVMAGEVETFGSNTKMDLSANYFEGADEKWLRFIGEAITEEEEFQRRLHEAYVYGKSAKKSAVELHGWRLDKCYQLMREEYAENEIEFEDKDAGSKGKLCCREKNPKLVFTLSACKESETGQFEGIKLEGRLPQILYGAENSFFLTEGKFYRMEPEFVQKIKPLLQSAGGNYIRTQIGRKRMTDFYYNVLPQLREFADIVEENPEEIDRYLLPQGTPVFYLDAWKQNVFCRVKVRYGDREFSALDPREKIYETPYRSVDREKEMFALAHQWFPYIDDEKDELHCGEDENLIYQVMQEGVDTLLLYGEVQCTSRFRNMNVVRRVKFSVGVSVQSGLMDLDISSEDVSRQELLDILNSYRAKKKYHRLKNGEFIDIDDEAIGMLEEMMETLHIPLKEFVKGKMHLPMYRALYMDKLLEENEEVYNERDSHFRKLVKNFKTVNEADFEVPKSLVKIMRGYQVKGYKWLRTLEEYGFGGILADDMGLGKTLQTIAFLLAMKEENTENERKNTLIVTPAALVFNWGEEIAHFAPGLSFCLVTGKQEERKEIIESYKEYDILVTSYDLLKRDIEFYEDKNFDYQIIDEAQYIKNHTTAAAKAVKVVKSKRRFALTGTPIENRLSELWSIFDYLMPGFLYGYEVFRKEIETPVVKNKDEEAMARLQKMVHPFILRRLKENVLKELPDKLEEAHYVKFEDRQKKLYDGQVVHMKQMLERQSDKDFQKSRIQVLAELTKLRQICCDPSLCFENFKGESAKLESCISLVTRAIEGGHKILLFSQFTSMLEILQNRLKEEKIDYYVITGATSKEKRLQLVKAFNEDETPVFLISLKAGGVGLNLTGADVVIHYDPWWNVAAQNQATDRAHRIGQTKKVTVYKLIAKATIEEKIQELQNTKKDLAEQVLTGEGNSLSEMTKEDFLELLS